MRPVLLALVLLALAAPAARAEPPVDAARALLIRYHEDRAAIDRARALLEAALQRDRQVETMVALSYVQFLTGDVRATTEDEKLAAYERGRELGRRAVELAPKSHDAHLWYAINTGRWGQTKGVLRSLFLLPTVREELDILLELDPRSVRAHAFAGNVFLEVPRLFGGDRERAEKHFQKALGIDPHFTVARVDLARLYIGESRWADARREIDRVIAERAPTIVADWTVKDLPRARALLESIAGKK
ncbi:MAG: tetratricopeptide repeat protein [Candidatus Rokubacteria bacterium]|nr:tetratricopeptide repeat protein [Candidatus Rokubacteria bacterium]